MATVSKSEIVQRMEQMKDGAELSMQLDAVFGGGFVFINLNASYPGIGQKKYLMRWGKKEAETRTLAPFMASDKAKEIAGWVADRAPHWIP